eukprot:TRINITY_DN5764_c0_g1_i1.p1 TRINITY_DN5764_c0_g1~~TRINITY_DN5764_c0_g1_i1.p1  ORF type:complete len:610 (+),score=192.92 TRINITY_DN5764_c0_g1_i1:183-2012(+)
MAMESVDQLLVEFKRIIRELDHIYNTKGHTSDDPNQQTTYYRWLARLCFVIEKILSHDMKDTSVFSKTTFWDFLENLPKCLPGMEAKTFIALVKDLNKGSLGRGRIFIRMALNEKLLAEYLRALIWHPNLVSTYYKKTAILSIEEQVQVLMPSVETLDAFDFNLSVKDALLDADDYWQLVAEHRKTTGDMSGIVATAGSFQVPSVRAAAATASERAQIQNLVALTDKQEKEIRELRERNLGLKIEIERERLDAERARTEKDKLTRDFGALLEKINDMQVELQVYKSITQSFPDEIAQQLQKLQSAAGRDMAALATNADLATNTPSSPTPLQADSVESPAAAAVASSPTPVSPPSAATAPETAEPAADAPSQAQVLIERLDRAHTLSRQLKSHDEQLAATLHRLASEPPSRASTPMTDSGVGLVRPDSAPASTFDNHHERHQAPSSDGGLVSVDDASDFTPDAGSDESVASDGAPSNVDEFDAPRAASASPTRWASSADDTVQDAPHGDSSAARTTSDFASEPDASTPDVPTSDAPMSEEAVAPVPEEASTLDVPTADVALTEAQASADAENVVEADSDSVADSGEPQLLASDDNTRQAEPDVSGDLLSF